MRKKSKAFTLIEVIVAMAVLMIVMTMITLIAREVKYNANITLCSNNLRQISIAMTMYYNDHRDYPKGLPYGTLAHQLDRYIENKKVFICPKDQDEEEDSYSQYYVYPGESFGSLKYILGCPRHKRNSMTAAIFSLKNTQKLEVAKVIEKTVFKETGNIHITILEDGSKITSKRLETQLIQSFHMKGGYLYSVIRVPEGQTGSISVKATKGTRLEIVTPAAIAAVRGTAFTIQVGRNNKWAYSDIKVTEGTVAVKPIKGYKKKNNKYTRTGKDLIILKKSMRTKLFRKKARLKKKRIRKRIKRLKRKIRRGVRRGRRMRREKMLCNWLSRLIGGSVRPYPGIYP